MSQDEDVRRLRNTSEIMPAIEIWFFRDIGETQRRQLFNICGFPGVEANGQDLQLRLLRAIISAALAASPSPVVGELSEPTKRMEKILDAPFVRRSAPVVGDREAMLGAVTAYLAASDYIDKFQHNGRDAGEDAYDTVNACRAKLDAILSSTPVMSVSVKEAFEMTHALIQEAKGIAGDGSVTDHLDAAEGWIDKVEAALSTPVTEAAQERE